MKFLQGLRFVILKYNEDLHAKCYVNDEKMVITSLNLYEFSMANNKEMGVLIDKNDPADIQLYEDAFKEVDYINQTSQGFELSAPKVIASNYTVSLRATTSFLKAKGIPDQTFSSLLFYPMYPLAIQMG